MTNYDLCDICGLDMDDLECQHYCRDCADELPENNPDEDICSSCMDEALKELEEK